MDIDQYINFRAGWLTLAWYFFLIAIGAEVLLRLTRLVRIYIHFQIFTAPEAIRVTLFLLCLIALFILVERFRQFLLHRIRRNRKYQFSSEDWLTKWIFADALGVSNSSVLDVQMTRAGCLLRKYYWKDFQMTFDMQFIGDHQTLGIVFRALDLNNYFMLQLSRKHSRIRPHVRYGGGWDIVGDFGHEFSQEKYKVTVEVKGIKASLYLDNKNVFEWVLPTHADVNYWESPDAKNSKSEVSRSNEALGKKEVPGPVQEISFRLDFGMIGFRAYPGERATVRNLEVTPL